MCGSGMKAVIDAHEYTVTGRFVQKFNAIQRYDALLQYATTANMPEFITKAAHEWYYTPMSDALRVQKLSSDWYYTTSTDPQDLRVSMGGVQPDTGRGHDQRAAQHGRACPKPGAGALVRGARHQRPGLPW